MKMMIGDNISTTNYMNYAVISVISKHKRKLRFRKGWTL